MRPSRSGFILVIVVALLGIMAYLALQLADTSRLSRVLSQGHAHRVKARLSARSGLEKGIVGILLNGWHHRPVPFAQALNPAGDDRNRNGILDLPGEDPDGNNRLETFRELGSDLAPSMALEDPAGGTALSLPAGTRGVSWLDDRTVPGLAAYLHVHTPCIDLNAGITGGLSAEGRRYEAAEGRPYGANDLLHPFNHPLVVFLNAWGNYHKYRRMVRPNKTYPWATVPNLRIADPLNRPDTTTCPDSFDVFYPSELCGETPLGDLIVLNRPPGGYTDIEKPLAIVESYIRNWKDKDGNLAFPSGLWRRLAPGMVPGPTIDPVTDLDIANIRGEFMSLSSLTTPLSSWQQLLVSIDAPSVSPHKNHFTSSTGRGLLACRDYRIPAQPIDLNHAPESVLASLVHCVGNIQLWRYVRPDDTPDSSPPSPFPAADAIFNPMRFCPGGMPSFYLLENCCPYANPTRLFSMTESVTLASTLMARRPLESMGQMRKIIMAWRGGFDAKTPMGVLFGTPLDNETYSKTYHDRFSGELRSSILGHILTPHYNSPFYLWDEALMSPCPNRINGIGQSAVITNTGYGGREFHSRFLFDKRMPHEAGPPTVLDTGFFSLRSRGECLGPEGTALANVTLAIRIHSHTSLVIHSQADFEAAICDPLTGLSLMPDTWMTYPEPPGVPPATWDGHLALKPTLRSTSPASYGNSLRARVLLHPYDSSRDPGEDVLGAEIWPRGTRVAPPPFTQTTGTLRNSLLPAPGEDPNSIRPAYPGQVDTACDLAPGGGMRVTPFNNSFWAPFPKAYIGAATFDNMERRETVLSLRNALVNQAVDDACPNPGASAAAPKILPSFTDGGVSFWFKPIFTPPMPNNGMAITGRTLFYTHFTIHDEESINRLAMVPELAPYLGEAEERKWYTAYLRLVWGHFANSYTPNSGTLLLYNGTTIREQVLTGCQKWPYIQTLPSPYWPGFNQDSTDMLAAFPTLTGLTVNGVSGHLPSCAIRRQGTASIAGSADRNLFSMNVGGFTFKTNDTRTGAANTGEVTDGHWWSTKPFPNEALFLEFQVMKYASIDESAASWGNVRFNAAPLDISQWALWGPQDLPSNLARTGAYVNPASTPLHLFDTTDPSHPDYHSVRKVFIVGHPINPTYAAGANPDQGKGPLDRNGDHQGLVAPGRWNHFHIAWRNLYSLLDNSIPGHRGGCLAVYVNGALRKSVGPWQIAGMMLTEDYCEAYRSDALGNTSSPWEPTTFHNLYQNTSLPFPFDPGPPPPPYRYGVIAKTIHWPHTPITDPSFSNNAASIVPRPDFGDMTRPTTASRSNVQSNHMNYSRGHHDFLAPGIWNELPPRFYFGCEPHSRFNRLWTRKNFLYSSGVAWGSFMDIQIYANSSNCHDPSGGFMALHPAFTHSPLPTSASVDIHPLLVSGQARGKLVRVSWSAHLPEFHKFWDDTGPIGPDGGDTQSLEMGIWVKDTIGVPTLQDTLRCSQDPSSPISREEWIATAPLTCDTPDDLRLTLGFTGPPMVTSTPILEDLRVTLLHNPPIFSSFQFE